MNRISTFLVMGCVTVFLISLFACGGGGGGDGGGGFVPVSYTGSTTLATIDGTNASYFTDLAGAGTTFGGAAPNPYLQSSSINQSTVPVEVLQTVSSLAMRMPAYLDLPQSGQADLMAAVPITDPPYLCTTAGQITTAGTWDAETATLSGTQTFTDCDEGGGAVFNGQVSFEMTGLAVDGGDNYDLENTLNFSMSQTYLNLSISFQNPDDTVDTITVYAVMDFTFDTSTTNWVIDMSINTLVMALQGSPQTAQIKNYAVEVTQFLRENTDPTDDFDQIIIQTDPRAEIYDYYLGRVYASTVTPILETIMAPYSGIARVDGADNSFAEVDFDTLCTDGISTGYIGTYTNTLETASFCYIP